MRRLQHVGLVLFACAVGSPPTALLAQTPYRVKDLNPGAPSSFPKAVFELGGVLFMSADEPEHGRELWKTDGTDAGTTLVVDIQPGPGSGWVEHYDPPAVVLKGIGYFVGDDGVSGPELWRTDGTAAGTAMVKDIQPGAGGSDPFELTAFGDVLVFTAVTVEGRELWKSDGTDAGTVLVKDILPGGYDCTFDFGCTASPGALVALDSVIIFSFIGSYQPSPSPPPPDKELWRTDGTAEGTWMVKDINPSGDSDPYFKIRLGGVVLFGADDGVHGNELWVTDGTPAGTSLLKDLWPVEFPSNPSEFAVSGGRVFFQAQSPVGAAPWTSDGTAPGTSLLKDIAPGSGHSAPMDFTDLAGTVFFHAKDDAHGWELWKSDGSEQGTVMVKDLKPGIGDGASPVNRMLATDGALYFPGDDGTHGVELWKTDGSEPGTTLIGDIVPGPFGSYPDPQRQWRSLLLLAAYGAAPDDNEPWVLRLQPDAADLSIMKTNGQATAIPGYPTTYTIVASNAGAETVTGATVTDTFPAAITNVTWSCTASAGSSCGSSSGSGNIHRTVILAAGGSVIVTASGTISASANGTLSNTATLTPPGGVADPDASNNTATDTDTLTPPADLAVSKTDGQTTASPGAPLSYAIVVSNAGPNAATGAAVTDTVPGSLTSVSWTCLGAGGGTCTANGSGSINDTVNLPMGASVSYTLNGTVVANPSGLINTATVSVPAGMADQNPGNNSATDEDLLLCFGDRVVVPDARVMEDVIGASATTWFLSRLKIGSSYSLEFNNTMGDSSVPGTLTVFSGADGCSGTSTLPVRDTAGIEPSGGAGSQRVSFTAGGTGTFFRARLVNGSGVPVSYSFGWSETTLYSAAWSTNGSFNTFYSFQNTTGATVSGTLTLLDTAGGVVSSFPVMVPVGQTTSVNTQGLGVVRNKVGTARFSHDGPPGAIQAEAAVANFTLSPAYIQPVRFQAVREAR